jgi:hypothetical protein
MITGIKILLPKVIPKYAQLTVEDLDSVRSLTENDFDLEDALEAYKQSIQVPLRYSGSFAAAIARSPDGNFAVLFCR